MKLIPRSIAVAVLAASFTAQAADPLPGRSAAAADATQTAERQTGRYEVTITNVSKLSFTPLLVVAHRPEISLTSPGAAPGAAIAALAEGGATTPLTDVLDDAGNLVSDYETTEGLLMTGQSVTVMLDAVRKIDRISVAAMLLPTNDSFVWLDSATAPARRGDTRHFAAAGWDAGSEPNDELCANIPGPTCGGAGGSPDAGGEGYVTVSAGIQGVGDLAPGDYDWRNPVATVKIRRVR